MRMHVCTEAHMYSFMWRPELKFGCLFSVVLTLFFDTESLIEPGLASVANMSLEPRGASCLSFPSSGMIDKPSTFYGVAGDPTLLPTVVL